VSKPPTTPLSQWERICIAAGERDPDARGVQTRIARLVGVTQPSVFGWSAGGPVQLKHLRTIAEKTGYFYEWLASGNGPRRPGWRTGDRINDAILDVLERMPESERAGILASLQGRVEYLEGKPSTDELLKRVTDSTGRFRRPT
jgi:hypothetical protein